MIAGAAFIPSAHASAFSGVVPSIFVYGLMAPRWNSNRDGARKAKAHPMSCNHAQNICNCGMVVALNQRQPEIDLIWRRTCITHLGIGIIVVHRDNERAPPRERTQSLLPPPSCLLPTKPPFMSQPNQLQLQLQLQLRNEYC